MDIRKFFTGSGAKCNRIAEKRHEESKTKPVTKATPTKQRTKKDTQITSSSSKPKSKPSREQKDENKDKNGNVEDKIITDRSKRQKTQDAVDKKQLQKKAKKHAEIDAVSPPEVKESSKKEKKRHLPSSDDETYDEIRRRPKKKNKKGDLKRGVIFDSDSEEEPIPKKRAKKVKKEYHLSSDEESKQALIEEAFNHANSGTKKKSTPVTKDSSPSPKKMVDIKEFFGNTPVQRKEQKQVTSKHSKPNPKRETEFDDDDLEIHDDDEFNETLRQLDDNGQIKPAERLEKTTLSSKIAKKVEESYWVGDTPEKTMKTKSSPAKVVPAANKKVKETSPGKTPTKQPSHTKTSPNKPETKKWAYKSYLNREGPRSLGSKEVPQGGENCLEGLNFVITGVLESFERDDVKSIIERYGGKVTGSVSKRTNYLIVGREAGDSKLTKANLLGTKIIDEDGLLDLIRTSPGKKSKYEIAAEKEAKSALKKKTPCKSQNDCKSNSSDQNTSLMSKPSCLPSSTSQTNNASKDSSPFIKIEEDQHKTTSHEESLSGDTLLWVDKYKPTSLKQIIGQQGDKSNAKKLLNWLKHWHKNIASGKKPAFNRFNDDGSGYRAALLSGPPGVGKTTTVHLVCQEAGFSFVELNASDTRSKRSLKEEIAESLNNHSLSGLFGKESSCKLESGKFHCLVMDEVDGMAGNEDRGGIQELVSLIKNTRIPIICMCNDRNHPKIRTLANYCFDLRFQRPRVEQIKSAMMSLAFKEGIKIPPPALNDIIIASNQDIRQVIHNLSMWSSTDKNMSFEQVKTDAANAKKDLKLGPFDVVRKVFTVGDETAHMSINDKSDLFFHDYSFGPLFVQENYISVQPSEARGNVKKHLQLLSRAADSIAVGDHVDRLVRGRSHWGLLPVQAIFASVLPGDMMRGYLGGQIQFPSWLGRNSTQNKNDRILQELKSHMRLRISCDKRGLNMQYLPHLRHSLTLPLIRDGSDGVPDVIKCLDSYDLIKEDFDSIMGVSQWPNSKDVMSMIESKTKAAFTRAYNKEVHLTPYAIGAATKKGRRGAVAADLMDLGLEEGEETKQELEASEDDEEDDLSVDNMIKKKKKTTTKKSDQGSNSSTSKGNSRVQGKGKGQGKGKACAKNKAK